MTRIGRGRRPMGVLSFALTFLGLIAAPVSSAPAADAWRLDDGFGTGGEVVTSFGSGYDEAFATAVQKDGKIVVAGTIHSQNAARAAVGLARYKADGTPDPTFGNGGTVVQAFNVEARGEGMALQPDGKIVVVGSIEDSSDPQGRPATMVLRFTSNGTLDTSFGVAGVFEQRVGNLSDARSVAVYPSGSPNAGKIVVAGTYSDQQKQTHEWLVLRLNPDGTLDDTFGSGGGALPDPGLGDDEAWGVAIDQNDRVIVVGYGVGSGGTREEVAVLKANGKLDTSFGPNHDGFAVDDYADNSKAWGVAVDPTTPGRFVVAGEVGGHSAGSDMAAWRYDATGGSIQRAFPDFFQMNDSARAVVVQPDGKIVLLGYAVETGTGDTTCDIVDFALARYNANMTPDSTFGNDDRFGQGSNKLVAGFGFGYDAAFAGALQSDGDVVAAGGTNQAPPGQCQSTPQGDIDFGVARFTGAGSPGDKVSTPVMGLLVDFTLDVKPKQQRVSWQAGGQNPSTTQTYDLRVREARWYQSAYDAWRFVLTKTRRTSTQVATLIPGNTYCYEARMHAGGQTSDWSKPECVATPVDDKTLGDPGKHWYRYVPPHAPNYYNGTGSGSGIKGAELHLDGAWFSQLEVVYTECKDCGRFAVYIDDRIVAARDSSNAKDIAEQLFYIRGTKSPSRHDVTIRVIDPGKRGVYIDGVGVSLAPKS